MAEEKDRIRGSREVKERKGGNCEGLWVLTLNLKYLVAQIGLYVVFTVDGQYQTQTAGGWGEPRRRGRELEKPGKKKIS